MSARILILPLERLRRAAARDDAAVADQASAFAEGAQRLHFWRGASGRGYVHTVFGLTACPALPAANYVLVRRDARGRPQALRIGRVAHAAPSLNLAELRYLGASLAADEVHVHLLAADRGEALAIEHDLAAAGQCAAFPAGPAGERQAAARSA